jgi:hypothetical protein
MLYGIIDSISRTTIRLNSFIANEKVQIIRAALVG